MDRDPASILDIVLACRRSTRFLEGRTCEDLDRDELFSNLPFSMRLPSLRNPPAASHTSFGRPTLRSPGERSSARGNRIIYGYENVKLDIVWDIAATKAAVLIEQLEPVEQPPIPESNTLG